MFGSLKLNVLIIILILLYHSKAQSNYTDDICTNITPYPPLTSPPTYSTISTTLTSYTSTDCVSVYQIDLNNPTYKANYVLIENKYLDFPADPSFRLLLVGKHASPPKISVIHQPDDFDNEDRADFVGRKPYQYIELLPQDTAHGGMYFIAIYRYFVDSSTYYNKSLTYTINVQTSGSYICPQDCFSSQNQGTCNPQNLQCDCKAGYFNPDCSVLASLLESAGGVNLTLVPGEWTYFYLPNDNQGNTFLFFLEEDLASVTALYQYSDPGSNVLPSMNLSAQEINMNITNNEAWFSDDERDEGIPSGQFVIGFYNNDNINNVSLSYQVIVFAPFSFPSSSSSSPSFTYSPIATIIVSSIIGGFILLFCLCIVRAPGINPRYRRNVILIQTRISQQPHQFLSTDEINEYFPKKTYRTVRSSSENTCSVCLDDFQMQTTCRRLYCGHVFHCGCIEEWFKTHQKCPNCNKLMTRDAINQDKRLHPNAHNIGLLEDDDAGGQRQLPSVDLDLVTVQTELNFELQAAISNIPVQQKGLDFEVNNQQSICSNDNIGEDMGRQVQIDMCKDCWS